MALADRRPSGGYQLAHFALANRVVALDLRGHGRSDRPVGRYSMDEIQGDLLRALDILGVDEPCVLLGHSFGGAVVSQFAAEHPERVERLVLIASAGEFRLSPALRFGLNLPLNVLRLAQPFAKTWLHAPFHVLKAWYANNLSQWNGWSLFRGLTMPALVIRGHWDFLFEKPLFEEVARAIPGAEDVDVGTSGHMVMLERRDAVNRALERFLSGEATRTWRQQTVAGTQQSRATLRQERPWLDNYEQTVPYTAAIPQIPVHRLLRSAVRRFPNRVALLAGDQRMTYAQLNKAVNRWANAMLGLGLQPGDRVALMLPNSPGGGDRLLWHAESRGRGGLCPAGGDAGSDGPTAGRPPGPCAGDRRQGLGHGGPDARPGEAGASGFGGGRAANRPRAGRLALPSVRCPAGLRAGKLAGGQRGPDRPGRDPIHRRHHGAAQGGHAHPPQSGGQHHADPPVDARSRGGQGDLPVRAGLFPQLRADHGPQRAHRPGGHPDPQAHL